MSYLANKNSTVPRSDESFGAGWQIARQELRAEELAARDEERRQREDREGVTKERAIWEGELTHRQNDAVAKHARVEEPHAAEKAAEHEAIDDELEQWKASHPEPSLELLAAQGA